jgi:hypothetical protein
VGSAKLDYIAYCSGVFHEAHRAQSDCEVLLHLLQHRFAPDQPTPMQQLLAAASKKGYRLGALGAPFETKDLLRARGYRWDAERRLWSREVLGDEAARDEAQWLQTIVHDGRACRIEVEPQPATVRVLETQRQGDGEGTGSQPPTGCRPNASPATDMDATDRHPLDTLIDAAYEYGFPVYEIARTRHVDLTHPDPALRISPNQAGTTRVCATTPPAGSRRRTTTRCTPGHGWTCPAAPSGSTWIGCRRDATGRSR